MDTKVQEHGLLFFGNQHETVPTRLLFDPYLTSRAKLAWQLIKYKAREFQSGLFPSYEALAKLLSDKPYDEALLSRKLVSQTLLLLRLTRWLTLCETVRNEQGQVVGNFYILHDEPMPIIDTIQLNHDYIALLEKSIHHKDSFVRGVANHIVENLLSDNTQWHYISHIDWMRARLQDYQQRPKMNDVEQESAVDIQENLLSSNRELSEKTGELSKNDQSSKKELSQIKLSSKRELSTQNDDKSLISGLVPKGNSGFSQYSTSTSIYTNTYCTGNANEMDWSANVHFSPLEKKAVTQAMRGLDLGICKAILFELEQRVVKGEVKKPQSYVMSLIQRAHHGEFKPFLYEQHLQGQSSLVKNGLMPHNGTHVVNNVKTDNVGSSMRTISKEDRQARAERIRQFKMSICG
ncbi:STY4528 family pathogenicity island replication protein [uncultured Aggregatibacter sp.]|uniref:STY4528 family pathogenicity island replication protein n=1 Tax=uncultured Aggregatibacter sp. TaxID=470564 RepID=UPI001A4B4338|nr:STY4528 family pathogenicity island replication protein [uncultured Aggregatibacter sp.]VTX59648.1 Uncharacterised protein [uncultured Aggregatibacter sp.]